jgi:hypothetical protein
MSMAFGITELDVLAVLERCGFNGIRESDPRFIAAMDLVSMEDYRIEKAALYGDDMDEQTDYALQEIETILREDGRVLDPSVTAFDVDA